VAVWRLFAAFIAVALFAVATWRIVRIRRRSELAGLLLEIPVPALGFLYSAIAGGRMPELDLLTVLATLLIVIGIFPVFISRRAIHLLTAATVDAGGVTTANRYVPAARACLVLGISGYVAIFEPWFGVANLVLAAAWVAAWIPKRWRRLGYEVSVDVPAAPASVFAFLVDPSNWPAFQVDLESVVANPQGPLTVGSEVVTRRVFAYSAAPAKSMPASLESHAVITSLLPGTSFTAAGADGSSSTTEVQPSGSGSRVSVRAQGVTPFTSALLGLALEAPQAIAIRRQTTMQSMERLGEALARSGAGSPSRR
jgi:hypothetical protein